MRSAIVALSLSALAFGACTDKPTGEQVDPQVQEAERRREVLCRDAQTLEPNGAMRGNTAEQTNDFRASCGSSAGGPDNLYVITLQKRSLLRLHVRARHHAVLHLHGACPGAGTELTCTDHYAGTLEAALDAGRYFVVVDGQAPSPAGPYELTASAIPLVPEVTAAQACGAAQPLPLDDAMALDVAAGSVRFPGECQKDRPGTVLHRLNVEVPTRIALRSLPTSSGGAVSILNGCGPEAEELFCERFEGDGLLSLLDLAPGSYAVAFASAPGPAPYGPVSVLAGAKPLAEIAELCEEAPVLRDARTVEGENHDDHGLRRPPCNTEVVGTETVYRLNLEDQGPVTIDLESATDAALYLRRDCNAPSGGDVSCRSVRVGDQASDLEELERLERQPRRIRMTEMLAEGSYWVYVDSAGSFRMTAYTETRPPDDEREEAEEPEEPETPEARGPPPDDQENPWQGPAGRTPTSEQ